MNHLKENSVGIDIEIERLQIFLYDNICKKFCLDDFNGYGRVYKNKRNGLIIPEYYESNRDYREVLLDDRISGTMFFNTDSEATINGTLNTQDCEIIFTFNLNSLLFKDGRDDEYIRQYIILLLNQFDAREEQKTITTGLENVYRDFNGVAKYFYDMQDYHHFKITKELRINTKCI